MALGLEITELRLGLPGHADSNHLAGVNAVERNEKKRVFSEMSGDSSATTCERKAQNKNQVVGWPPVCSYRRKNSFNDKDRTEATKMYVKVSMDGAPFLRKIDLSSHQGYFNLVTAFEELFGCFGIGEALKDADSSEYIPIYEDKDGDWMLVGDVPWEMFIESCKRLRIKKKSETKNFGLQLNSLKELQKIND
ncbi:hypothetical protein AAG906_014740 [Vitis piasezkii]|uniref:Auxin-responsive protein n=4 Tax=Vitis vinifera TaxID=29760 RepID=E5L881_VITVI|nr:auxin-induced protein 22A-like [Vitis vinifera]ADR80322.1 indole-3-acetic acid-induced protein 19 [Vitis vinifera]WJZ94666.1 hypothetical protein VitviT2T_013505 [Vitis vinifera]|eukprot:NP_001268086.1 auxin-induced protein 22A-like [Vitis vinifera]